MKKGYFIAFITCGVIVLIFLIFLFIGIGARNTAVSYDEKIQEDTSNIGVERKSAVKKLEMMDKEIDKSNSQYQEVIVAISEARKYFSDSNQNYDHDTAATLINVIAEAYPENLGNHELFNSYIQETIVINDNIKNSRELYNKDVKSYRTHCKSWPNSMLLGLLGYQVVDYKYLDIDDNTGDL